MLSDDVFQDEYEAPTIDSTVSNDIHVVDLVSPKLRKSLSDPTGLKSLGRRESAVESLDRCLSLASLLNCRIDRVASFIKEMPGVCKQCHGQTGSGHTGSRWGYEHCTLLHNDDCLGGLVEVNGVRKACPPGFIPKAGQSGNETEVSQQRYSELDSDSQASTDSDPDYVPPGTKEAKVAGSGFRTTTAAPSLLSAGNPVFSVSAMPSMVQTSTSQGQSTLPPLLPPIMSSAVGNAASSISLGGPSLVPSGTMGQADSGIPQNTSDIASSMWLQHFLQNQQALQLQQQQQQQAMLLENQRVVGEMKAAVEEAKHAARSAASVRRKDRVSFSETVIAEAEVLKSLNTKDKVENHSNIGKDMNDVRRTQGLRDTVESYMAEEVYKHPSLARAPTARSPLDSQQAGLLGQQPGDNGAAALISSLRAELALKQQSLDSLVQSKTAGSKHERRAARKAAADKAAADALETARAESKAAKEKLAAARETARQAKKAAISLGVQGISSLSSSGTDSGEESELDRTLIKKKKLTKKYPTKKAYRLGSSSSSDEADKPPSVVTDNKGRAFKVVDGKLVSIDTYVKDPLSGRMIKTTPSVPHVSSTDSSENKSVKKKEKKQRQKARRSVSGKDSVHGITPLLSRSNPLPPVPHLQENRGKNSDAKDRQSSFSLIDWVKMCPVKYAATCNSKNLNLPVFMWARLAELRALTAGATQNNLEVGELDARLRHMQCVLELIGTNSTLTEFAGYGWQLGRDYDRKVQATMDSGASDWVSFNSMFSLGPHPSFVLSAKDEVEKVVKKTPKSAEDDQGKSKKKVCYKFNSSKTSKRCEWEVDNPNRGRCKSLHQCSYCKLTHNRSVFHQAWDCPAGGKEAVAAGTHSL